MASPSRVAVIGAGAIGGVVAAVLSQVGHEVTVCVRRPIPKLVVEIDGDIKEANVRIVADPGHEVPVDWVLIATKVQDTPSSVPWLEKLVGPNTVVVALQNGIDHVERLERLLKRGQILPTVVYTSAELIAPGHVRHHTGQRIVVPSGPLGDAFTRLFDGSSLLAETIDDFTTAAWRKLFGNVAVNPITALTTRRIGVMRDPDIRALAAGVLMEAVVVGRAAGAKLDTAEIDQTLDSFAAYNPGGGSSMLYDRLAGKPMEHEHLTGALVRAAERHGIDVPLNRAILALLRGLDGVRLTGE